MTREFYLARSHMRDLYVEVAGTSHDALARESLRGKVEHTVNNVESMLLDMAPSERPRINELIDTLHWLMAR